MFKRNYYDSSCSKDITIHPVFLFPPFFTILNIFLSFHFICKKKGDKLGDSVLKVNQELVLANNPKLLVLVGKGPSYLST
jgi:hypothetical protein